MICTVYKVLGARPVNRIEWVAVETVVMALRLVSNPTPQFNWPVAASESAQFSVIVVLVVDELDEVMTGATVSTVQNIVTPMLSLNPSESIA